MWWKIYFWLIVALAIITSIFWAGNFHNLTLTVALHTAVFYIEVLGLFSYLFRRRILWQLFWLLFFWLNAGLDVLYLLYALFPHVSVVQFAHVLFDEQPKVDFILFGTEALDVPMLYAFYRLSQGKFYEPDSKKVAKKGESKIPFKWGMLQIALWGYSSILTLLMLVFVFFSSNVSTSTKGTSDIFFGTAMYAPLLLFWLWVIARYKGYYWNWWRTTLVANAVLYTSSILYGALVPQAGGSSGFDIVSVLILIVLLIGLYVFGREQFK